VGFGSQLSLQRVAACLSAIWFNEDRTQVPQSLNGEIDQCMSHGIESSYYQDYKQLGQNNFRVRYRIDVDQFWTLVTENGHVYRRLFLSGETVVQGVSRALREISGQELHSDRHRPRGAFLVVMPRQELGQPESYPFWGRLALTAGNDLSSIFIVPSDTIHVTKKMPKPWQEKSK
jgi:hypothetical protein